MQIDIVSDTICPWCFIGKRRLERALEQKPDVEFEIQWRPYRLDPTVPKTGIDRKAYLKAKFGDGPDVAERGEIIRGLGAKENIAFEFGRISRTPNTLDSHRLIRWAGSAGVQDRVVESLFTSYFEQGRDIGDPEILEWVAAGAGMDGDLVRELLAGDADVELVEREDALAHRMRISGVPTFIFANKYLVSGAQDPDTLVRIIEKIADAAETTEEVTEEDG
ncbi:MAG: DsbA family oxidoreductase [Rhizomicrobium sp.]|jgi:predicted DsbA family dithiol-disulfide isomerase